LSKKTLNNSALKIQILKCLHYFNLFDHPLTITEIQRFLSVHSTEEDTSLHLSQLVHDQSVLKYKEYFGLQNINELVQCRIKYEKNAIHHHDISIKNGIIIQNLPFISGVCISGSLSKGVMKDDADIDYFIIAKGGKIWLAKFFVKSYKFLFLKNQKELFCTNYFISDKNLSIEEQNQYTATELATLIPINSKDIYEKLMSQNTWVQDYLPNINLNKIKSIDHPYQPKKFKVYTELLLSNGLGSLLNHSIRYLSIIRSNLKYKKNKTPDFELMYRSSLDQIKVHDSNHQQNTLRKYYSNISNIES